MDFMDFWPPTVDILWIYCGLIQNHVDKPVDLTPLIHNHFKKACYPHVLHSLMHKLSTTYAHS